MAPSASDPRHLLVVLNVARRKALFNLVSEITAYMRSQLELPPPHDSVTDRPGPASPHSRTGDTPLFVSSNDDWDWDDDDSSQAAADVSISQRITPPPPELIRLRRAALAHIDTWRADVLSRVRDALSPPDDAKLVAERRARLERLAAARAETPSPGEDLIDFGALSPKADAEDDDAAGVASLQALYHPIPTRLTTIPVEDRREALAALLLVLLASGAYAAEARVLALYLASALGLPLSMLVREETEIARSLVEGAETAERQEREQKQQQGMSADAEAQKRRQDGQNSRYWKVGLASVAGAALIGVTGGLAAPVVAGAIGGLMGTVGLGGVASFLGIFWMNGALVGALFGAFGARMTGEMMDQYAREVDDFRFLPLQDEWGKTGSRNDKETRRLRVTIGINGWLTSKEDVTKPWRCLGSETEVFALRYEMDRLLALGSSLEGLVSSSAWNFVKIQILKRTVLASLWSALWPAYLIRVAARVDNPFSLARNRSEKAGEILADALINKVQGARPVTLIGYSLGARVIYSCLRSLAVRRAFGLVENVVFIGAPIPSNRNQWLEMRSVVSGKMHNVFSENDYILAFLYRATSIQLGIAGLQAIRDVDGVKNLDLSAEVQGHLRYPELISKILTRCGFPDVKGGDGPIEREHTEISLQDEDLGRSGTLIDFDDLTLAEPDEPKPSSKVETQPVVALREERRSFPVRKTPKTVIKTKSEALADQFDPLQSSSLASERGMQSAHTKSTHMAKAGGVKNTTSEPADLQQGAAHAKTSGRHTIEPVPMKAAAHEAASKIEKTTMAAHQNRLGNSSDEEDGHGIQLVNNDDDDFGDMLEYTEPIPIED